MKVGQQAYTELSIQIAVLQASVDKLLELAMKNNTVNIIGDIEIMGAPPGHGASWDGVIDGETFDREFK